jgi:hypothetical protein
VPSGSLRARYARQPTRSRSGELSERLGERPVEDLHHHGRRNPREVLVVVLVELVADN